MTAANDNSEEIEQEIAFMACENPVCGVPLVRAPGGFGIVLGFSPEGKHLAWGLCPTCWEAVTVAIGPGLGVGPSGTVKTWSAG